MFHSVGRIMRWAGAYRKRMVLGFVCSFFATWCTAGPVMLAAWALGQLIVDAWGEESLSPRLPWLCLGGIVVLILLRFFFTYWKNRLQESIGTERAAEQRMELGNVLKRVSLLMEIMNEDGTMARLPELRRMADEFGLKLISIRDLIAYRLKQESIVEKGVEVDLCTRN